MHCAVGSSFLHLAHVLRALVRDHGPSLQANARFAAGSDYHRERLHAAPDLEVWLLSWLPGQITPIHDHGGAITLTAVLSGTLIDERFARTRGLTVRPTGTVHRRPGELEPIDFAMVHRVRPLGRAISLHVYAPACADGQVYEVAA